MTFLLEGSLVTRPDLVLFIDTDFRDLSVDAVMCGTSLVDLLEALVVAADFRSSRGNPTIILNL